MKRKVARNLAKQVEAAGFHLDVGVLGAKAILNALSENGEAETAYKLAAQDTYPSWGCWIANGATTLLENWDLNATRDISDNHMMFGEIGGWFYKGLGGIFPDPENPGFKHILLRPNFPSGLNEFEARYQSPYGEICSKWERKKNRYLLCTRQCERRACSKFGSRKTYLGITYKESCLLNVFRLVILVAVYPDVKNCFYTIETDEYISPLP